MERENLSHLELSSLIAIRQLSSTLHSEEFNLRVLYHIVHTVQYIIEGAKPKPASYRIAKKDYRLDAVHVLASVENIPNDLACGRLCTQEDSCRSFTHNSATGTCQLNNAKPTDSNATLLADAGSVIWKYELGTGAFWCLPKIFRRSCS